jgi:hypothetical protein
MFLSIIKRNLTLEPITNAVETCLPSSGADEVLSCYSSSDSSSDHSVVVQAAGGPFVSSFVTRLRRNVGRNGCNYFNFGVTTLLPGAKRIIYAFLDHPQDGFGWY